MPPYSDMFNLSFQRNSPLKKKKKKGKKKRLPFKSSLSSTMNAGIECAVKHRTICSSTIS